MSCVAAPCTLARSVAGPSAVRRSRLNQLQAAPTAAHRRRAAVATSASLASSSDAMVEIAQRAAAHPVLFQLAGNANELVEGCGVSGTCGQVSAPPYALFGSAILIGGGVLAIVTFGLKGGTDAAAEIQERDTDLWKKGKK